MGGCLAEYDHGPVRMLAQFFCARAHLLVAWSGLLFLLAHAAIHGWVKYRINLWYKDFYNLLETSGRLAANDTAVAEDWVAARTDVYAGLVEFGQIATVAVVAMPIFKWIRSMWTFHWRTALMNAYLTAWNPNHAPIEGASQRVHEDSYRFSKGVELCLSTVLDSAITLSVFTPILIQLGAGTACPTSLAAFAVLDDGWLVGLAFASALVGLFFTMILGHRLVGLEVNNQVVEAKLRRDLVLLETTPGSICAVVHLDGDRTPEETITVRTTSLVGDAVSTGSFRSPLPHFVPGLANLTRNYHALFRNFTVLNLFLAFYEQFNVILPYMIFAPLLFATSPSDRVTLGTLIQVSNSFDKVFGSLSVIADSWASINEFRSVLRRLNQFETSLFYHPAPPSTNSRTASMTRFLRRPSQQRPVEVSMHSLDDETVDPFDAQPTTTTRV